MDHAHAVCWGSAMNSGFAFLPMLGAPAKLVERGLHLPERTGLPGGIGLARDDDGGGNEHGGTAEGQGKLGEVPTFPKHIAVARRRMETDDRRAR